MSGLPTLQGEATPNPFSAAPIGMPSLDFVGNSVISSSSQDQVPICPVELRFISDFIACIQSQPFVPSNEVSLSCDFEDGSFCRFQPTSSLFRIGKLPLPSHYATLAELSGRTVVHQPRRNFAFILAQQPLREEELVITAPITCQRDAGFLRFNYWLIGDQSATVKVCTQDIQARSCTKSIVYTETSLVAVEVVHPQAEMFDVEIIITNVTQPTLFVLDDIDYKANLCEDSQPSASENQRDQRDDANLDDEGGNAVGENQSADGAVKNEEGTHSNQVDEFLPELSACQLLPCDFTNDICGYRNYQNETMSLVDWQLGNHRVDNISGDGKGEQEANGGFLFVGTDTSTLGVTTYILESPEFSLNEEMKLSFDVYRRSKDITLQVCLDTPFNCPYTVSPFDRHVHWKQGETFTLPKTTKKIYFKAVQWRKFKWLAIDNITLSPCPQPSSSPAI
ncbi:hypothetical protein V3C99_015288 [Haemonchus contortus]